MVTISLIHLDVARVSSPSPSTPLTVVTTYHSYGRLTVFLGTNRSCCMLDRLQCHVFKKLTYTCSPHILYTLQPQDYVKEVEYQEYCWAAQATCPRRAIRLALYACRVAIIIVKASDYKSRIALGPKLGVSKRDCTNKLCGNNLPGRLRNTQHAMPWSLLLCNNGIPVIISLIPLSRRGCP